MHCRVPQRGSGIGYHKHTDAINGVVRGAKRWSASVSRWVSHVRIHMYALRVRMCACSPRQPATRPGPNTRPPQLPAPRPPPASQSPTRPKKAALTTATACTARAAQTWSCSASSAGASSVRGGTPPPLPPVRGVRHVASPLAMAPARDAWLHPWPCPQPVTRAPRLSAPRASACPLSRRPRLRPLACTACSAHSRWRAALRRQPRAHDCGADLGC